MDSQKKRLKKLRYLISMITRTRFWIHAILLNCRVGWVIGLIQHAADKMVNFNESYESFIFFFMFRVMIFSSQNVFI